MDEFLVRALVAGLGVAAVCGPLGCLVVWQRMVYFGAALSHAALLGVALGLLLQVHLGLAVLAVCTVLSVLLVTMERTRHLATDTALGILAHGSLAGGIVLLGLMPAVRVDLVSYLFGDILAVSWTDVAWTWGGGAVVLAVLARIWRPLLSLVIQRDLALVDGVDEGRLRLVFLVLLSFVVAAAMQVVGILLVVSLLIIPVAGARFLATSPEQMAGLAAGLGMLAVAAGLALSLALDTPAGPSIVVAACAVFVLAAVPGRRLRGAGRA